MSEKQLSHIDNWLDGSGPQQHIVISSRVRYARNIENRPFPPRADLESLKQTASLINRVVQSHSELGGFNLFELHQMQPVERLYLKESHIISTELERGEAWRQVHINPGKNIVLMVNEEDHIRMYCMQTGFQLFPLLSEMNRIDDLLSGEISYAWHERFGYLSACPTNTGTGIRGSVMLHLPGLALMNQVKEALKNIHQHGITVRGFYGENSDHLGNIYQISNETTLGKNEEEIINQLISVVEGIIQNEEAARERVFEQHRHSTIDLVCRAFGILRHAHQINSQDAMQYLSRIRLGIDQGLIKDFTHADLSKLMVEIQPAHLQIQLKADSNPELRDTMRAQVLRQAFAELTPPN